MVCHDSEAKRDGPELQNLKNKLMMTFILRIQLKQLLKLDGNILGVENVTFAELLCLSLTARLDSFEQENRFNLKYYN